MHNMITFGELFVLKEMYWIAYSFFDAIDKSRWTNWKWARSSYRQLHYKDNNDVEFIVL